MTPEKGKQTETEDQCVLDASALLDVPEFELFRLAYRHWFGNDISETELESCFVAYMFERRVPFWVRYFAKEVLDKGREGTLDPVDFGVRPAAATIKGRQRGIRYLVVAVLVVFVLVLIAHFTARLIPGLDCFFPPCY